MKEVRLRGFKAKD